MGASLFCTLAVGGQSGGRDREFSRGDGLVANHTSLVLAAAVLTAVARLFKREPERLNVRVDGLERCPVFWEQDTSLLLSAVRHRKY
jgi:hypothetical protein